MKYTYAYKTSDGVRHEAAMDAPSREAVFEALRAQGIRAIKVVAADGSKANGEVRGVRKRIVALVVVGLLFAAVLAVLFAFRAGETAHQTPSTSCDRHQVYGDPATIQEIESGSLPIARTDVEKFLFNYAIPGKAVSTGRHPSEVRPDDLVHTPLDASDRPEVTAYKQILNGLKDEARAYLAGGGTWRSFVAALNERQQREIEIYERTRRELEADPTPALRDERNAALRALGLRTIPRPRK